MTAISNSKTWTKIYRSVASGADTHKTFTRTLKNDLITAGFSHVMSCDSVATSSSTDLWDSDSDIVHSTGNHSWIILSNSNICTGFQICIDLNSTYAYQMRLYVASSGYSGGSISSKPIATNEIEITDGATTWTTTNTSYTRQYNMFYSSDGQCVRVYLAYSGATAYGLFDIEKIQNAPSWLTIPVYGNVTISTTTRSNMASAYGISDIGDKRSSVSLGGYVAGMALAVDLSVLDTGDYNAEHPCLPVLVLGLRYPGILGNLADAWHANATATATFDYFPGTGEKTQVVIGDLVQGSDGSTVSW